MSPVPPCAPPDPLGYPMPALYAPRCPGRRHYEAGRNRKELPCHPSVSINIQLGSLSARGAPWLATRTAHSLRFLRLCWLLRLVERRRARIANAVVGARLQRGALRVLDVRRRLAVPQADY